MHAHPLHGVPRDPPDLRAQTTCCGVRLELAGLADPHQVQPEVAVGELVWTGWVTALGRLGGLGGLEGDAGGVGVVFEAELGACGGNDVFDGEAELGL